MTLATIEEHDVFRQKLRAFIADYHPGRPPAHTDARFQWRKDWARTLAGHGYAAPGWPKEHGGMDLDALKTYIYHEEFTRAGCPMHPNRNGLSIAGPTIIRYGNPQQQDRHLRPMLAADEFWCQGYSEPEAGSDLASLRTTAVQDGDHYVVNGQKTWTTHGHHSDWMFALVRTGPADFDHRRDGISFVLIDLRTPGIDIRPLREMSGGRHFAEVFFDDVRVPVENRVGEENHGWYIARTSLGFERSTAFIADEITYSRLVDQLIVLAKEYGSDKDPLVRQDLAQLWADVRVARQRGLEVLANVLKHGEAGPASSINRLSHTLFQQRLFEVAANVMGSDALLHHSDPRCAQHGKFQRQLLLSRAATFGGGTSEIQKNVIAERILGLPRDQEATAVNTGSAT